MVPAPVKSQSSRLRTRLQPGTSGLLAAVFSQVRVPAGKFGLERLFARTRHSCLFLNDTENGWYLGLDDEIDAAISKAIEYTGASDIVFYGSSMGGYGALAAGLRHGTGTIHAFGPELKAGAPGSQSAHYGIRPNDPHLFDLRTAHLTSKQQLHLYYGIYDPVDAANAAAANTLLPGAELHLLHSCHASHDHLYSLNLIRRIITTFSRNPGTELASKDLLAVLDLDTMRAFGDLAEIHAGRGGVSLNDITSLKGFEEHPGMLALAAEVAVAGEDLPQAVNFLASADSLIRSVRVLSTLPKRWRKTFPLRHAELMIEMGDLEAAGHLLDRTFAEFPADARMNTLARRLDGLGRSPAIGSTGM